MSQVELEDLLSGLNASERSTLLELLQADQEGVSLEEFRAINHLLDEADGQPLKTVPASQVFAELREIYGVKEGHSES